jgi:hypothetical protein
MFAVKDTTNTVARKPQTREGKREMPFDLTGLAKGTCTLLGYTTWTQHVLILFPDFRALMHAPRSL